MAGARNTTVTLTASTVSSVLLDQPYRLVQVEMGSTGPADTWARADGVAPTAKGNNCWLVAGVAGSITPIRLPPGALGQQNIGTSTDNQPVTVQLISAGTPTVTVSGVA